MTRNMERHIRIVGGIFIAFGIFYLLATLFIGAIGLMAWINEAQTTAVPFLPTSLTGIVILLPFTLLGILHLFTGRAFRAGRGWARFALWILAIINLGNVPLGTAIGAYAIWVLIKTNESANQRTNAGSSTVLHVHSHPHTHEVGAPDYHADIGTPDPSKDIDHSHTHAHTIPHQGQCTQCGEQLLTDGIGGPSNWNSVFVTYNSPDKSYEFRDVGATMIQYVVLAESCVGSTLRLNFGDGGGVGPLTVRVGVGNTVQQTTYTGGGLTFDVAVPVGPTHPVFVDIITSGAPYDPAIIINPALTVIC